MNEYRLYQYETDVLMEQFQPYRDGGEGKVIRPAKGEWVIQKKDRLGYWRNHEGPFKDKLAAEKRLDEMIAVKLEGAG